MTGRITARDRLERPAIDNMCLLVMAIQGRVTEKYALRVWSRLFASITHHRLVCTWALGLSELKQLPYVLFQKMFIPNLTGKISSYFPLTILSHPPSPQNFQNTNFSGVHEYFLYTHNYLFFVLFLFEIEGTYYGIQFRKIYFALSLIT